VDRDGYNTISSINIIYEVLTDNMVLYDATASDNSGAYTNFKYSVRFYPQGESVRERSGNPGYLYGYPLLFTTSSNSK